MGSVSGTHDLGLVRAEPIASRRSPDPLLVDRSADIRLRPWSDSGADVAALVAAWADPAIAATCGVPDVASAAAAARWIAGDAARRADGRTLDLVIARADDPRVVLGEVGLRGIDRGRGRAEVSWWIAADQRGRGLATAAVGLLAGWALSPAGGLDQVWARIAPTNAASAAVAAGAGFRRLGEADGTDVWARHRGADG